MYVVQERGQTRLLFSDGAMPRRNHQALRRSVSHTVSYPLSKNSLPCLAVSRAMTVRQSRPVLVPRWTTSVSVAMSSTKRTPRSRPPPTTNGLYLKVNTSHITRRISPLPSDCQLFFYPFPCSKQDNTYIYLLVPLCTRQ